jgi:hypothetical protein
LAGRFKPSGKRGRQQAYSDAAIQACLTIKVLFGLPLRQTTGFVESLLALAGLEWSVPDFSTLCRRQRTLSVAIPYRGSSGPLHLLIDSTGIKAEGAGEWNARKHGGPKRRLWRKIHIGIDEETLEIRAVEVTTSSIGDAPMLPDLLDQIPADEDISSVTADGAFDTRKCHDAIAARKAIWFDTRSNVEEELFALRRALEAINEIHPSMIADYWLNTGGLIGDQAFLDAYIEGLRGTAVPSIDPSILNEEPISPTFWSEIIMRLFGTR